MARATHTIAPCLLTRSSFVGLDFAKVARSRHQMLMHLMALCGSTLLPIRDGALIQVAGRDDGLRRTPPRQQGDDSDDYLLLVAQAIKGRPLGLGESLTALFALVAKVLATVNDNVARARLSFGRAIQVGAECCLRVHWLALAVLLLVENNSKRHLWTLILSKINASTF